MSRESRTIIIVLTPLATTSAARFGVYVRCDSTTWPGLMHFNKALILFCFAKWIGVITGNSFLYNRGCKQIARSRRLVPDLGIQINRTNGDPATGNKRWINLPGVNPNLRRIYHVGTWVFRIRNRMIEAYCFQKRKNEMFWPWFIVFSSCPRYP